ncbi:MAG: hypothetical protein IT190_09335 [Microbacteriaceae bacterium]|nr:hypothetical protein [Microbacteriaceae bacterium]
MRIARPPIWHDDETRLQIAPCVVGLTAPTPLGLSPRGWPATFDTVLVRDSRGWPDWTGPPE